ncbi:hypothetical protein [Pantoea phytobeneficialis]|uniref:Pectate lyase superfamily protein domain-containing protein n=1 Tax=Pantoea phytobeneficialis TaxID=2052056 RepID=A0AAP9HA89_9GAMM|nr:hypothetical protein [Pantoea phytobeneficialis]MDO6407402.1 hypothetical protein [Pantoea phytobeneficialis]QGR09548.1 hypothetical protein CTZ24_24100 [Pantoea phytobeneficialis]
MRLKRNINRRVFFRSLVAFITCDYFISKSNASENTLIRVGDNNYLSQVVTMSIDDLAKYHSRNNDSEVLLVSNDNLSANDGYASYFVKKSSLKNELIDGVMFVQGNDCVWERVVHGEIYPEWFGAKGNENGDDTEAFIKANNVAHEYNLPLRLRPGMIYCLSDSFTIDASKTCWTCNGKTSLLWTKHKDNIPAITLISTQSNYKKRYQNVTEVLNNINLIGGDIKGLFRCPAIQIGGPDTSSSLFTVRNVSIQGWQQSLLFSENAWRIKFENCQFLWGHIETINKYQNAGECMVFDNCMFADNTSHTKLYYGDWNFTGCSFDNHEIIASGNSSVFVSHSHMENPGRNSHYYVIGTVASTEAFLSITDSFIFLNKKEIIITTTLFNILAGNDNGLYLDNIKITLPENYDPSTGKEGLPLLVGGEGRSVIGKLFFDSKYIPCISKNSNIIFQDPMFHAGGLRWNLLGKIEKNETASVLGASFLKITDTSSSVEQMGNVDNARVISGALKLKIENCFADIFILFRDLNSNEILRDELTVGDNHSGDWQLIKYNKVVPPGTHFVSIRISALSGQDDFYLQLGCVLFNYV